jgi:sentrin-specific protease 7
MTQGLTMQFPKEGGKHSVEVDASVFDHLDPEEFLNDTVIDFYIR